MNIKIFRQEFERLKQLPKRNWHFSFDSRETLEAFEAKFGKQRRVNPDDIRDTDLVSRITMKDL